MEIAKLIVRLITIGMTLACAGQLVDATIEMSNKAYAAHSHGLISLGAWNRQLQGASGKTFAKVRHEKKNY